jgi:hypothetical protein
MWSKCLSFANIVAFNRGFDGFMLGLPLEAQAPERPQPKRHQQQPAPDAEAIEDEALYNALYSRSE